MTTPSTIEFARSARADLDRIFSYIAEVTNAGTARDYRARLDAALDVLLIFPDAGTPLRGGLRRLGFERRITVLYRAKRNHVQIVRVLYAGRHSPLNATR